MQPTCCSACSSGSIVITRVAAVVVTTTRAPSSAVTAMWIDVTAAESRPERDQLDDQPAVGQLEGPDDRHRRLDPGVRQHGSARRGGEPQLGAAAHVVET